MFRKRQKKSFPPGTFIPTPARICAIIQLCLAFSALLWYASEPFVGEIFTLKSQALLYQDTMGISKAENSERQARNAARFNALPKHISDGIATNYQHIQTQINRSFWDKLESLVVLFSKKISPYELAWIFFSIVISILLLKKSEGAYLAVWLLPIITAFYAADIRLYPSTEIAPDARLFPSENELIENYLKEPLSSDAFEQHAQLKDVWKQFLVVQWTKNIPSKQEDLFEKQAEEGEFNFNVARLELLGVQKDVLARQRSNPSTFVLMLYFFWNTYFAYTAWKWMRLKQQLLQ